MGRAHSARCHSWSARVASGRPALVTEANPTTQPEGRKAAGRPDARSCLASWPSPPTHSSRSTTAGSTRVARSAGIRLAASAVEAEQAGHQGEGRRIGGLDPVELALDQPGERERRGDTRPRCRSAPAPSPAAGRGEARRLAPPRARCGRRAPATAAPRSSSSARRCRSTPGPARSPRTRSAAASTAAAARPTG